MYKYVFNAENEPKNSINTPFCTDFSQIKQEVIEANEFVIKGKSVYPNGFELIVTQTATEFILVTIMPLIKHSDGTHDVEL